MSHWGERRRFHTHFKWIEVVPHMDGPAFAPVDDAVRIDAIKHYGEYDHTRDHPRTRQGDASDDTERLLMLRNKETGCDQLLDTMVDPGYPSNRWQRFCTRIWAWMAGLLLFTKEPYED